MARGLGAEVETRIRCVERPGQASRFVVELAVSGICTVSWIQRHVQDGRVTLKEVDGDANVADLGTKHVDGKGMLRLHRDVGVVKMTSRSELSLMVSGVTMG